MTKCEGKYLARKYLERRIGRERDELKEGDETAMAKGMAPRPRALQALPAVKKTAPSQSSTPQTYSTRVTPQTHE